MGKSLNFTLALFNNANSSKQSQLDKNFSSDSKSVVILAVVARGLALALVVITDGLLVGCDEVDGLASRVAGGYEW